MKEKAVILFLALGHGLNDLIAGYFLGRLVQLEADLFQVSLGLFLYNLIAFGGQYPVALWLEKWKQPKRFLLLAYGLNVLAVIFFQTAPQLSIVLAGVASAIYHVAGGTVCARQNKAADIGLFAAPGVMGLIAGGYWAYAGADIWLYLLVAASLFLGGVYFIPVKDADQKHLVQPAPAPTISLDRHDIIMIILLTVISLRSVIWNIFQLLHEKDYHWLIAIAAAAFIGKIAGGWIADRVGWRLYTLMSLAVATPLLNFFKDELLLFCIGIGLLQSGIPATTSLLIHSMKGRTEQAVGLSFGTAIILGALVFYSPLRPWLFSAAGGWFVAALLLVLIAFLKPWQKKFLLP